MVRQRIAGIRSLPLLRAWRAVERQLRRGDDGGPRDRVLSWLDDREQELEARQDRDDRERYLPEGPLERTESSAAWSDCDGGSRSSTFVSSESTFGTAVADGGTDRPDWQVVRERYDALGRSDPVRDDGRD
jgi:hypothetical protein